MPPYILFLPFVKGIRIPEIFNFPGDSGLWATTENLFLQKILTCGLIQIKMFTLFDKVFMAMRNSKFGCDLPWDNLIMGHGSWCRTIATYITTSSTTARPITTAQIINHSALNTLSTAQNGDGSGDLCVDKSTKLL